MKLIRAYIFHFKQSILSDTVKMYVFYQADVGFWMLKKGFFCVNSLNKDKWTFGRCWVKYLQNYFSH